MRLDMTRGKPSGLLLKFAFPLMLSALLQQMYNLCDSLIVGRFLGAVALTATGSAGTLHCFPLFVVCSAVNAYAITLSQRFGARDREGYRCHLAWALLLALGLSLLVSVFGVSHAAELFRMLGTPEELMAPAGNYLRLLWLCFPLTALMNLSSATLMSMGDSRTPLIGLMISTAVNIALDLAFLAWLQMDIRGAALATVLAQGAALLWNLRTLLKRNEYLPRKVHFRFRWPVLRELLRLSIPQMLSSALISSGELLVQSVVNGYGVVFVMGINAARRYFSLLNVVGGGLEGAVVTYVGQNWGAGNGGRIRRGVRFATGMGFVTSTVIGAGVFLLARVLIRFLLPEGSEEAVLVGTQALRVLAMFLPSLYLLCEFRAAIQGMGNVVYPMMSGFVELAMRIGTTLLLPLVLGRQGLYFTDAAAWVPTMLLLMVGYALMKRRLPKNG